GSPDSEWLFIGRSPLKAFLLPVGYFRSRITKPGFRTLEAPGGIQGPSLDFHVDPPAAYLRRWCASRRAILNRSVCSRFFWTIF
ncbi:MAG: hypothetical protein ACRD9L_13225, partial [Bryobacteraceae bacterium]